jgi:hypothetical protein
VCKPILVFSLGFDQGEQLSMSGLVVVCKADSLFLNLNIYNSWTDSQECCFDSIDYNFNTDSKHLLGTFQFSFSFNTYTGGWTVIFWGK